jgi:hypothetical protein
MKYRRLPHPALLLISLFVLTSSGSFAQNFGVGFSPEFSYRNLVKTDFVPGIDEFVEESNRLSEQTFGYTAEAFFIQPFSRTMSFETGLSFSQDGYNSVISDLSYESLLALGLVNSDDPGFESTQEIETRNRFYSVGIPLRLAYVSDGKKIRITWAFGITPELLVHSSTTRTYRFESGTEESFDNEFQSSPSDFNITASFSAGVELPIDRTSAFRIEPIIRYGALPTFDESTYEINLFSYGLSLKYLFRLDLQY